MEKVVKIYKTLSQTPVLTGARILDSNNIINTFWTQRNIESGKNVKFMQSHVFNKESNTFSELFPVDISQEALVCVSSCGGKRAVLREINGTGKEGAGKQQFIEVWTNNCLSHSVDLAALNVHGDVYTDVDFRTWVWSPCDTKILYVAERKPPKTEPFYSRRKLDIIFEPSPTTGTETGKENVVKGDEYRLQEEWGEQMVGKKLSVAAFYDLNEDKVELLAGIPDNLCPGQMSWAPDGSSVIGVSLETEPRRFGLVYCSNRLGQVFQLDLKGNYKCLSEEKGRAVHHPRFCPTGDYVIWFERDVGGPHQGCMRLMKRHMLQQQQQPEIVVDIVRKEQIICNNERFYGIYVPRVLRRCWTSDNRRIVISTIQQFTIKTYVIDIDSGDITELKYGSGSLNVLDVLNDQILVSHESYLHGAQCILGVLPEKGGGDELDMKWTEVTAVKKIAFLQQSKYELLELEQSNNDDEIKKFSAMYLGPKMVKEDKTIPLIMCPHGGPHSAYFNSFTLEPSVFVALGYAIVFVNYRGSTGQGEDALRFLTGQVGTVDVADCVVAVQEVLRKYPWLDEERVGLVGGSHGGFLVHHLSGQYPDMFKAVVSRNPVIDIATMSIISDIPDWSSVEAAGAQFDPTTTGVVDDDLFLKMRKMSPIKYAHNIKAPTYLMLGSKDLRVPYHQGLELYHRLKINGTTVKASLYEDNHPLASVPHEMDHIINSALWLLQHIPNNKQQTTNDENL